MRKSTQSLFKRLEESRKAKTYRSTSTPFDDSLANFYGYEKRPSSFPTDTLGYFSDQLRLPPALLIEEFSRAGIVGLSVSYKITQNDKAALLRYLRAIHSAGVTHEQLYVDAGTVEQQLVVVQAITDDLLRRLAEEPRNVYQLSPRKFEELIAKILEDQGYEVTLTKQSRDGGYDILGRITSGLTPQIFLAECKRYLEGNRVGVEVVRGLYGITEMQKANFGMIVTTSSFTRDAHEEKLRIGLRMALKDFRDLKAWLQKYEVKKG